MAVDKPEMKSYIWVQTADGRIQQMEEEIAVVSPLICREMMQPRIGSSKNNAISLPERVTPTALYSILEYFRFHQAPGRSNKERRIFDDKFVRIDLKRLCELASASHSLQIKPLVDLTASALARIIEGRKPEEIRDIFNLPDDLTEEEKLEPLRDFGDDPRIRLLNRLYARKRKELKQRETKKDVQREQKLVDERSVDDLLSFINGGSEGSKGAKVNKQKKKNRKKKDHLKEFSTKKANMDHPKELDACSRSQQIGEVNNMVSSPRSTSKMESPDINISQKLEFDDVDIDDGLDPEMKAQIDREVEDFARRLNSDWPERMQEIFSLGQEKRLLPLTTNVRGCST